MSGQPVIGPLNTVVRETSLYRDVLWHRRARFKPSEDVNVGLFFMPHLPTMRPKSCSASSEAKLDRRTHSRVGSGTRTTITFCGLADCVHDAARKCVALPTDWIAETAAVHFNPFTASIETLGRQRQAGRKMDLVPRRLPPAMSPPTKSKRSTVRENGANSPRLYQTPPVRDASCLNLEPVRNNQLAGFAQVSPSTASEFFTMRSRAMKYR